MTTNNNSKPKQSNQRIPSDVIFAMQRDRNRGMSLRNIAVKYCISLGTVAHRTKALNTKDIKKEIEQEIIEINREVLTKELQKQGVDAVLVAEKIKNLLNSETESTIIQAVREFIKIYGLYADESTNVNVNRDDGVVFLPMNGRNDA